VEHALDFFPDAIQKTAEDEGRRGGLEKREAIGIKLFRSTNRIHPDNKTYYKYAY
jgi:hypothetical protein